MRKRIIALRNLTTLFHCFMASAVIGWLYEVLVYYFEYHEGLVNRGFFFGPYLPIYGFGGLFSILIFYKIKKKKIMLFNLNITPAFLFILETLFLTAIEFVTSYIMELLTGGNGFLWDYSVREYGFHFQGRIALISSLRFGILGLIELYIVYPLISFIVSKICSTRKGEITLKIITWIIIVIFATDVIINLYLSVPLALDYIKRL